MKKTFLIAAIIATLMAVFITGAHGAIANPDFVKAGSDFERLEFRSGGTNTWEIGLGRNTQGSDMVNNQSENFTWTQGTAYDFSYEVSAGGDGRFIMGDLELNWSGLSLGNTLEIHAKRGVSVSFGGLFLEGDPDNAWGTDFGYIDIDPLVGFKIDGTITFTNLTQNSGEGVTITMGNTPVPVPATISLLGLGLLGIAGVSRRRQ